MPGAVSQIVLFADDAVRHGTIDFLNQNHSDLNTKGTPFGFLCTKSKEHPFGRL